MSTTFDFRGTRTSTQAPSYTPANRNTFLVTPTFPSSADSTSNDFNLTTIAAIIIPIFAVLAILSFIYRVRRRTQASRMVVATTQQPHPAPQKNQNVAQTYNRPPRPDGFGTFQQHFVESRPQWNAPMPPPPPPPPPSTGWENSGMDSGPVYGAARGQSGMTGYNQHTDYGGPVQEPQLMRNQPTFSSQTQFGGSSHGQESRQTSQWERGPIRTPSTSVTQNQPSFVTSTPPVAENISSSVTESDVQPHTMAHGSMARNNDGRGTNPTQNMSSHPQHNTSASVPPQLGSVSGEYNHTPASTSATDATRRKGDVVLEWIPEPETVSTTPQAGPSNTHTESSSQPQDTPELNVLRERVQRLEAALADRDQPGGVAGEPDRPPPAYSS